MLEDKFGFETDDPEYLKGIFDGVRVPSPGKTGGICVFKCSIICQSRDCSSLIFPSNKGFRKIRFKTIQDTHYLMNSVKIS